MDSEIAVTGKVDASISVVVVTTEQSVVGEEPSSQSDQEVEYTDKEEGAVIDIPIGASIGSHSQVPNLQTAETKDQHQKTESIQSTKEVVQTS